MTNEYILPDRDVKTILIADQSDHRREYVRSVLKMEEYRILEVDNLLLLIEALNSHRIDLLVSEVDFPGIMMVELLSYIRKKYFDMKVILTMECYSPELELNLRPYKILYVVTWPIREDLLRSIVARGLEVEARELAYINCV